MNNFPNKPEEEPKKSCPDFEGISAYFDGELSPASPEFRHIESCAECRKRLELCGKISGALGTALKAEDDNALVEKIRSNVKNQISLERRQFFFRLPWLARAAAVALAAGAVLYGIRLYKISGDRAGVAQTGGGAGKTTGAVESGKREAAEETIRRVPGSSGGISISNMRPVSTGEPVFREFKPGENGTAVKPVFIPEQVHHIWLAKNPEAAAAGLAGILSKLKIPEKSILEFSNEDGKTSLALSLTKLDLAVLVRRLSSGGYKLLSPAPPQPEQNLFYGAAGDQVEYRLDFAKE